MGKKEALAIDKTPARICEQRRRMNWTQAKLAEEISRVENDGKQIKDRTVADWEKGKTTPPLQRIQIMSELFDCDVAYLIGDGENGARKRVSTDIVALTGLSLEAAEKIAAIKRAGLSGQLSSLLEWNDFISLLRKVNSAIAFVAGMNLREYDLELYKASADEPERATEFFANILTPVRVDSKEYENQKLITDDLEISEAFSTDEYGDMMKARAIREFERYLDSTLVSLDLMLERQMKEAWLTSKNAATKPGG